MRLALRATLIVAAAGCRPVPVGEPRAVTAPAIADAAIEPVALGVCEAWRAAAAVTPTASDPAPAPRTLTDGEIALIEPLFRGSVDYTTMRVDDEPYTIFQAPGTYVSPDGNIYAPGELFRGDFAADADLYVRGVFVHESVHVWQYQSGVDVMVEWMRTVEATAGEYWKAYPYTLAAGRDLLDYGLEQQASLVEDYYLMCAHELAPIMLENPPATTAQYEQVLGAFLTDPTYLRAVTTAAAE